MRPRAARAGARRDGFTALEMAVASALTALLALLLANVWSSFCRPALTASAVCRLTLEANLALRALARDLGGAYPGPFGQNFPADLATYPAPAGDDLLPGDLENGQLVGVTSPEPQRLELQFHFTNPPNLNAAELVVVYTWNPASGQLLRGVGGADVLVAGDVTGFLVEPDAEPGWLAVTLTFNFPRSGLPDRVYRLRVLVPGVSTPSP